MGKIPSGQTREKYRKFRKKVTSMIREHEQEANFKQLAGNHLSKTIYRTLTTQDRNQASRLAADEHIFFLKIR